VLVETPLTVVSAMKNSSGMAGITNPVGVPASSMMAHGQAAIEISRSAWV
jgi:hypothetical protein